jgi:NADPH-dependent ferric siderophore reductase
LPRVGDDRYSATVLSSRLVTPVLRRLVLGGDGLAGFRSSGVADEWLQLFVPTPRGPQPRWYTVRRFQPVGPELTVDVVRHDGGPASAWAERAQVGAVVEVSAATGRYGAPAGSQWELIVADQTGLPAASRILEEMPAGRRAYAILEAPDECGILALDVEADLDLRWVFNPSPDKIASPLAAAARAFRMPPEPGYVWMAGEASCARVIRRYLRHELGWSTGRYDISGYWRPKAEAYLHRYRRIEGEVETIWNRGRASDLDHEAIRDQIEALMETHGL